MKSVDKEYLNLVNNIGATLRAAQQRAVRAINKELVQANWEIGRHIVEFEQSGSSKAEYGSNILNTLSKDLKAKFGKGFSKSNIYLCRAFYLKYPIFQTVSGKLSWSHYAELLTISDDLARNFYENQSVNENWGARELKRQVDSSLFERLALSTDKEGVMALASKGQSLLSRKTFLRIHMYSNFLIYRHKQLLKSVDLNRN